MVLRQLDKIDIFSALNKHCGRVHLVTQLLKRSERKPLLSCTVFFLAFANHTLGLSEVFHNKLSTY